MERYADRQIENGGMIINGYPLRTIANWYAQATSLPGMQGTNLMSATESHREYATQDGPFGCTDQYYQRPTGFEGATTLSVLGQPVWMLSYLGEYTSEAIEMESEYPSLIALAEARAIADHEGWWWRGWNEKHYTNLTELTYRATYDAADRSFQRFCGQEQITGPLDVILFNGFFFGRLV